MNTFIYFAHTVRKNFSQCTFNAVFKYSYMVKLFFFLPRQKSLKENNTYFFSEGKKPSVPIIAPQ